MAATIIVRALGSTGDPLRGSGLANFLTDLNAVGQIITTRMRLLQGEWYENLTDGLPLFQQLLGHPITLQALALIIRQRILATPYVTGILSLSVVYVPAGRTFTYNAFVQTQFGTVIVSNQAPTA